jgi:glucose-6-phosphate 1-dehydrogenase
MVAPQHNIPTTFIAFGATGDLMRLKVIPALFHLYRKKELPDMFRVIGFSRRPWRDEDFQEYIRAHLNAHADDAAITEFAALFSFQQGDFDDADSYDALKSRVEAQDSAWGVCANKLIYLAVAPEFYTTIAGYVAHSNLSEPCAPGGGWVRIVVEKPFGNNADSAHLIDESLARLFSEEQIYRIDHYLGKEMLQNILSFRFSNNLFEIPWGKDLIERIDIRLLESIGAEKRGAFYDSTGTLRDVGQNHFLQMLALVTMDHPRSYDAAAIRSKRAAILERLEILSDSDVRAHTVRAQHAGFRHIPGVAPDSTTETYFKVRATLDHDRWRTVPIYMEGGKRMGEALKEIVISLRHPMPCLCPPDGPHHTNEIRIRIEPKEEILIGFWTKKLGLTMQTEPRVLHFLLRERTHVAQYTEEYERLVLDCIRGDQTNFISTDEIRAMWRYIDPIVAAWKRGITPLYSYIPDTRDISAETIDR